MEDNQNPTNNPGASQISANQNSKAPMTAARLGRPAVTVLIVLVVAVIVALLIWFMGGSKKTSVPANPGTQATTTVEAPKGVSQTDVDPSKLPDRFPADVPLEAGAQVTANYTAVNAAGMFQSTREFISKKSILDNYELYQAALEKAGWKITSVTGDAGQRIILAAKGENKLTVRIYASGADVKVLIANQTKP
jgi:hypothetical protein